VTVAYFLVFQLWSSMTSHLHSPPYILLLATFMLTLVLTLYERFLDSLNNERQITNHATEQVLSRDKFSRSYYTVYHCLVC